MKTILTRLLITALLISGLTGCQTTSTTIEDVAFGVHIAALTGGQLALEEDPGLRPKFEEAVTSLNALIAATNVSPAALHSILVTFNIKELKSKYARVIVAGAEVVYRRYTREVGIKTPAQALTVAMALRDGLQLALDVTKRTAKLQEALPEAFDGPTAPVLTFTRPTPTLLQVLWQAPEEWRVEGSTNLVDWFFVNQIGTYRCETPFCYRYQTGLQQPSYFVRLRRD